jgi:hypothetical protein
VEIGGDGRIWFGKPAAVLTTVGERNVKGLGLMRLWRIDSAPRGCPHDIPVCGANQYVQEEQHGSTFVRSSAQCWQSSGKSSNFMGGAISKWADWMSYMTLEDKDNSETRALEEALHAFSRIPTMPIQSHPPFHFRASQIEKVFIAWRHAISDVSSLKVFFALMYLLYGMVAVVTVHSLATIQIESIVHETEYRHFMLVCVFFLCTTPFALAVAAYVSIYAPAPTRKKYIWVRISHPSTILVLTLTIPYIRIARIPHTRTNLLVLIIFQLHPTPVARSPSTCRRIELTLGVCPDF